MDPCQRCYILWLHEFIIIFILLLGFCLWYSSFAKYNHLRPWGSKWYLELELHLGWHFNFILLVDDLVVLLFKLVDAINIQIILNQNKTWFWVILVVRFRVAKVESYMQDIYIYIYISNLTCTQLSYYQLYTVIYPLTFKISWYINRVIYIKHFIFLLTILFISSLITWYQLTCLREPVLSWNISFGLIS